MNRKDLLNRLKVIASALGGESLPQIYQCFCFDPRSVFSYNDKVALIVDNPIPEFTGAVNGKLLLNFLKESTEDEIEFVGNSNKLIVQTNNSKLELPILTKDDFAFKNDYKENLAINNEASLLILLSALTTCFVSTYKQGGIIFNVEDGKYTFYSTDRVKLSRIVTDILGNNISTINYEFISYFLKFNKYQLLCFGINNNYSIADFLVNEDSDVRVRIFGRTIENPNINMFTNLLELVNKDTQTTPPVEIPANLASSLARVNILVKKSGHPAKIIIENGILTASVNSDKGSVTETVNIPGHSDISLKINPHELLDILNETGKYILFTEKRVIILDDNSTFVIATIN